MNKSIIDNLTDEEILEFSKKVRTFKDFTALIGYSQSKVGKNTRQKIKNRLNKLNIQFEGKQEKFKKEEFEKLNIKSEELGFLGEVSLMELATTHNIHILKPLIDAYPYDLVLEKNGKFLKFQVKTTQTYDGITAYFHLESNPHNGSGKKYALEDADYFYLYNPTLKEGYIIKNSATNSSITLRYKGKHKNAKNASNYLARDIIKTIF